MSEKYKNFIVKYFLRTNISPRTTLVIAADVTLVAININKRSGLKLFSRMYSVKQAIKETNMPTTIDCSYFRKRKNFSY